jgi:hypothetical protein
MRKIVKESENAFNYEAYFFNHWRYIASDITHTYHLQLIIQELPIL